MKPPIRMVCTDCLNSVESDAETEGAPFHCPICGGIIDGRLTDQETPTTDVTRILHPERNGGEVTPWTETWSKGSLGTIGRYQLRELLGDGGFGQVYQAYDPRLDRDVALKILKMATPGERVMQRFFREARAAGRLQHPNIVGVYDAGRDAGRCWIAYQFVKGSTLSRRRDSERMDQESAVRIIRDLADALDYAHREGVYHRDLKPANILIDERGRPRLTDFGLARRADLDSDLTRDGTVIGTPAYMSPEQARGQSNQADERSDVYSLGVMLFELLCGQRPGNQPSESPPWTTKNRNSPPSPPPPLRSLDRTIPVPLERICLKALAPNPGERYPNARALGDDLDRWLARGRFKAVHALALFPLLIGLAAGLFVYVALRMAFPATETFRPSTQPANAIAGIAAARPPDETAPPAVVGRPNPAVVAPEIVSEDEAVTLIGNAKSKKYHFSNCPDVSSMMENNKIKLRDLEDAISRNLSPCDHCDPLHRLLPGT